MALAPPSSNKPWRELVHLPEWVQWDLAVLRPLMRDRWKRLRDLRWEDRHQGPIWAAELRLLYQLVETTYSGALDRDDVALALNDQTPLDKEMSP